MIDAAFEDTDGITVAYRRWMPRRARGIVLVLHGASEHSGRYARFADALTDAGWAVYAVDHRGHGGTAALTGRGRIGPRGIEGVLDDVDHLRHVATEEVSDVPVVVFGHSMGALVAQAYVERRGEGLAGCILSGSPGASDGMADIAAAVRAAADGGMADEPVDMLGQFNAAFEPARTPYDWLSRDDAEVNAYIADPDCGDGLPLTYGFVAELTETVVAAMDPAAIASIPRGLPILLVTGTDDAASNFAAQVRDLERRLRDGGLAVTAHYYAGARHEVLNETNRGEVHDDVVTWLNGLTAEEHP